ncbi:hypothetical protein ACHAQH_000111 [Verticillium albo-atrum]
MSKYIITVFGATGNQGGSVVDMFVNDPKLRDIWAVRAVTRDAWSAKAHALAAKGVEVMTANLDDMKLLVKAMTGASAVFAMTDYWDKTDGKVELQQGKNLADAAKKTRVDHFIWSSLNNVTELSNGVLVNVYHFDSKAHVEEYVRQVGIPASFFLPGFFMSNISGSMFGPGKKTSAWKLCLPIGGDKPIPLIDIAADTADLGGIGIMPVKEIIEVYKRLFPKAGRKAAYVQVAHEDFKKIGASTSATDDTPHHYRRFDIDPVGANILDRYVFDRRARLNQNAAAYSSGMANPYGSYGGAGYNSYSRMGGYGGYGGSMGGMYGNSMYGGYGGYGGSMYGGGMYGGMPGMGQNPNDPNSLTNQFNNSTQATFQMLQGVVQAFGGFAQMLESTYMATHSSFFAMVSVAEQFGNLKDTLGSILGIFTLMRWIRTLLAKLTGRPPPADATSLTPAAFARFEGRQPIGPDGAPLGPPKASRKPLFFFVLAAFGLPYLMRKMINTLAATAEEEERKRLAAAGEQTVQQQLDPSKLDYCRALYDFTPQPGNAVQGVDMDVRRGDLVAVLSKSDPIGNPSEWWRCRARDGRTGYLPSTYLEVIKRPGQPLAAIKAAASESSRTSTMTSTVESVPEPVKSKVGDVSAESFQKSQFYS